MVLRRTASTSQDGRQIVNITGSTARSASQTSAATGGGPLPARLVDTFDGSGDWYTDQNLDWDVWSESDLAYLDFVFSPVDRTQTTNYYFLPPSYHPVTTSIHDGELWLVAAPEPWPPIQFSVNNPGYDGTTNYPSAGDLFNFDPFFGNQFVDECIVGWNGLERSTFLYFEGAGLPAGARITSAYLNLYLEADNQGGCNTLIRAERTFAPSFPVDVADFASRPRTAALVTWVSPADTLGFVQSPDISSVIQEIVDANGGTKHIQIFHESNEVGDVGKDMRYRSDNTDPDFHFARAQLYISWSEPVGSRCLSNQDQRGRTRKEISSPDMTVKTVLGSTWPSHQSDFGMVPDPLAVGGLNRSVTGFQSAAVELLARLEGDPTEFHGSWTDTGFVDGYIGLEVGTSVHYVGENVLTSPQFALDINDPSKYIPYSWAFMEVSAGIAADYDGFAYFGGGLDAIFTTRSFGGGIGFLLAPFDVISFTVTGTGGNTRLLAKVNNHILYDLTLDEFFADPFFSTSFHFGTLTPALSPVGKHAGLAPLTVVSDTGTNGGHGTSAGIWNPATMDNKISLAEFEVGVANPLGEASTSLSSVRAHPVRLHQ